MDYLPLFLDLHGKPVLVVGAGEVALRKMETLQKTGADIQVIAPDAAPQTTAFMEAHALRYEARPVQAEDLTGRWLVVAATSDARVNEDVSRRAQQAGQWVNVVDQPALSNCIFPSLIDRDPVIVAISTGGQSPTLARVVRGWLDQQLPPGLGRLASFIAERRDRVKAHLAGVSARQRFWQQLLESTVPEQVLRGDAAAAERGFGQALAAAEQDAAPGSVALVGAGPGDPELLTLKGLRLLQGADVVFYDNLANRALLDYARRDAEKVYVGKKRAFKGIRQDEINALLIAEARRGRKVVRLKGGDPFIFGRGGEEIAALVESGIEFLVVPGITAALGSASYAGIPLTHREAAQSVRFVTGHRAEDRTNLDWPELAKPGQTLVIYMGLPGLADICRHLVAHGLPPDTPAALVEKATLPEQQVVVATVETLAPAVAAAGVTGPTLIIIGQVVAHRVPAAAASARKP